MRLAATARLLGWAWFRPTLLGFTMAPQQSAWTQTAPDVVCIAPLDLDTGPVFGGIHVFPGGEMLIAANKGLFLAHDHGGKLVLAPAGTDTGDAGAMLDLQSGGVLIRSSNDVLRAREVNGRVIISRENDPNLKTERVLHVFQGAGTLVWSNNRLFQAIEVNDKIIRSPLADHDGNIGSPIPLSNGEVLFPNWQNAFVAREVNGKISVVPIGLDNVGIVRATGSFASGRILIGSQYGLFLAQETNGRLTVAPVNDSPTFAMRALADGSILIASGKELLLARELIDQVDVAPVKTDAGLVYWVGEFAGQASLMTAMNGIFLASQANGGITVTQISKTRIGRVTSSLRIPGGLLMEDETGVLLAQKVQEEFSVEQVGDKGSSMVEFPPGRILLKTTNGLFLSTEADGKIVMRPIEGDIGDGSSAYRISADTVLIPHNRGLSQSIPTSLSHALVDIRERKNFDGATIESGRAYSLHFTVAHACAPVAGKFDLQVRATAPGEASPRAVPIRIERVAPGPAVAEIATSLQFDKPGRWSFQVLATSNGIERKVGEPLLLNFAEGPWWERWWKTSATVVAVMLALMNVMLFGLARRSSWAWRLATDDGLSTSVLRAATVILSHVPLAQLWILDLYFQRIRARTPARRPFLPLPLTGNNGNLCPSPEAVAPPWKDRRVWIQGSSGMGKTALFREITESHFREHETAFAAYAAWKCIIVAFAARDFAGSGEDKDDPAWVVEAVRATLSGEGLTFANKALLERFLESGTLGIAIDGLNEVDRTKSVSAFRMRFSEAPIFVTSQEKGEPPFDTWQLPDNIRDFTSDLLRLYLTGQQADDVMQRITASGLRDAIRSGYDVRLIIDLVRSGGEHAELPADRIGLYAAVVKAGWPNVPDDTRREQQSSRGSRSMAYGLGAQAKRGHAASQAGC